MKVVIQLKKSISGILFCFFLASRAVGAIVPTTLTCKYTLTPLSIDVAPRLGWRNALPLRLFGRFNLRDVQQTGRPVMKADLRIRYTDGSDEVAATDESWLMTPGPVIRNNVYLGEHYDARLSVAGWNNGRVRSGWTTARLDAGPSGEMVI